jgi:hypothetical protein
VSALTAEALAAAKAAEVAAEASRERWRGDQVKAALDALRAVLVRADGIALTLTDLGVSRVSADLDAGLVIWSDGMVSIAAQRREAAWSVHLVEKLDGQWTLLAKVESLAELGRALARG